MRDLIYTVYHRPVNPFDHGDNLVGEFGFFGFAADLFGFFLELLYGPDRQVRIFHLFDEVGAQRVDGNAALGNDHVDEFAGAADGRDFITDHGDSVTEKGNGKDHGLPEEGVHPAAYAVKHVAVAMGDHVCVEVHVDFGGAEDYDIDQG